MSKATMSITIDADLKSFLSRFAKETGLSTSAIVGMKIREIMDEGGLRIGGAPKSYKGHKSKTLSGLAALDAAKRKSYRFDPNKSYKELYDELLSEKYGMK